MPLDPNVAYLPLTAQFSALFSNLFSTDGFPARWECGEWTPLQGWLYILSDLVIFLAYMSMPVLIAIVVRRKETLIFKNLFLLSGGFILFCGFTHLIDAIIFWYPIYGFSGLIKFFTALISVGTVLVMAKVAPKVIDLKDPGELNLEIERRKFAEERLELAISGMNEGIWDWMNIDDSKSVWWSLKAYELVGYSPDEIEASIDELKKLIHPDHKQTVSGVLADHLENKAVFSVEFKLKTKSNGYQWFHCKGMSLRDDNGRPLRMAGSLTNIHKRKMLEHNLKLKNELMEEMMEVTRMGVWHVDFPNNSLTWSKQVYAIHEIEQNTKIELEDGINFYHPDHRALIENAVNEGMEKGKPWDLELKIITGKQNEVWVRAMGFPVFDENKLTGLRGLFQDIDKRKRAELDREEQARNLYAIMENTKDYIWSVDSNFNYIAFNTPFAKSIESTLGEYPQKGDSVLHEKYPQEVRREWRNYYDRAIHEGSYTVEIENEQGGKKLYSEVSFYPISDESGITVGCSCFLRDITERKVTLKELERSEAVMKDAQQIARIGNWEWDPEQDAFSWSDQLTRVLGQELNETGSDLGSFLSLIDKDARANVEKRIRESVNDTKVLDIKTKMILPDGVERMIQIRARNKGLREDGILFGTMQDITKQHKLQEELMLNLKLQEVLVNISVNFNLPIPFDHKINYALEFIGKSLGVSRAFVFEDLEEGALGSATFDWHNSMSNPKEVLKLINYENDIPSWKPYLQKYGHIDSNDHDRLPNDIGRFLEEKEIDSILAYPLLIDNNIIGFVGISDHKSRTTRPTTEKKVIEFVAGIISNAYKERKNQLTIQENEKKFRSLFEHSSIGMARLAMSGKWLEANDAIVDIFGYSREELYQIDFQKITHPDDLGTGLEETQKVIDGKKSMAQMEKRYLHKKGKYIWCQLNFSLVRDEDGNPRYYITQIQNINDRIEAEEKIARLYATMEEKVAHRTAQLNSINKELEAFSYSVSHDLRTPLRSIHGFGQALQEDYLSQLDETGQDYLSRICKSAKRMGNLIDDLLNLSKISKKDLSVGSVDMTEIARRTINQLTPNKKYKFKVQDNMVGTGDPQMVGIIFDNLISNAIKYSKKVKSPIIEIGIEESESDHRVFSVKDNGAGFDMVYGEKIFGAFQRLHDKNEFEGTGIGLATVQRIINKHGGKIWAESKIDEGATFFFHLGH